MENAHFYLLKHDELQDKIYNEERLNDVKVGGLQIEHDEINRETDQIKKKEFKSFKQLCFCYFFRCYLFFVIVITFLIENNKLKAKGIQI